MSQPGYGDSYGAGYRANQGQQNSQSYNPQGSWGNQGINMDNQSEVYSIRWTLFIVIVIVKRY